MQQEAQKGLETVGKCARMKGENTLAVNSLSNSKDFMIICFKVAQRYFLAVFFPCVVDSIIISVCYLELHLCWAYQSRKREQAH